MGTLESGGCDLTLMTKFSLLPPLFLCCSYCLWKPRHWSSMASEGRPTAVLCASLRAGRWGLRSDYNGQNYRISPQVFWGLGEEQTLAEIKDQKYHRASRETWWEKPECGNVAKEHGLHFSWTKSVNLAEPVGLYFLSQSDLKKILKKIFPLWEIESHLKLAFR